MLAVKGPGKVPTGLIISTTEVSTPNPKPTVVFAGKPVPITLIEVPETPEAGLNVTATPSALVNATADRAIRNAIKVTTTITKDIVLSCIFISPKFCSGYRC